MARNAAETKRRNTDRCVTEILARSRARKESGRCVLPPDYSHGAIELADAYRRLPGMWVERAMFAVVDRRKVTTGCFDDYFLEIETFSDGPVDRRRFAQRRAGRDRVVALQLGGARILEADVSLEMGRRQFQQMERSLLGLVREELGNPGAANRRGRRLDLLSLIGLIVESHTDRLCEG